MALLLLPGLLMACGSEDPGAEATFYVAGTVEGLQGSGLVLQNNGDHDLEIDADGEFWFAETFADGQEYNVTVAARPSQHFCEVRNGSGVIDGADIVDIAVTCELEVTPEPTSFDVTIEAGLSTLNVQDGGLVTIVATVANRGEVAGTQDISLEIDGDQVDSQTNLSLSGGADDRVTLQWQTEDGVFGSYTAVVRSEDGSDSATVTVGPESGTAYFEVVLNEAVSTLDVIAGEVVRVRTNIFNRGDVAGQQEITLAMDGEVVATRTVEVPGNFNDSFELEWFTGLDDAGSYTAEVASADDAKTVPVNVAIPPDPPFFEVAIDLSESDVEVTVEEDPVIIAVDVANTGEVTDTQDVVLSFGEGLELVESGIELDGQESTTLYFEWATTVGDVGNYTATVASLDTSDEVAVVVYPPAGTAHFDVAINEFDSELVVEHGELVEVVALIENLGDTSAAQDIILEIDGVQEDMVADIAIDGGDEATVTLQWQTEVGGAGIYTATVFSADGSASKAVTVIDPNVIGLSGVVSDAQGQESFEGAQVVLFDSVTGEEAAAATVSADGTYSLEVEEAGDYDLVLRAPGLEPNYSVAEVGGGNLIALAMQPGPAVQDLTVDWQRTTDLIFHAGSMALPEGGTVSFDVPGCTQQPDGSWVSAGGLGSSTLDPDDGCFQITDVAIDLHTGALALSVDAIHFPNITVALAADDLAFDLVTIEELDLKWQFDGVAGTVDFIDGSMALDLDFRFLVGGAASTLGGFLGGAEDFGARDGDMDCQLTGAWGGDVGNPQSDGAGEQVGAYLHAPIEMRLTTGESGPAGAAGAAFDAASRTWEVTDNAMTIGAISEAGDPAGGVCGQIDLFIESEDLAASLNNAMGLPGGPGAFLSEFTVMMPE